MLTYNWTNIMNLEQICLLIFEIENEDIIQIFNIRSKTQRKKYCTE